MLVYINIEWGALQSAALAEDGGAAVGGGLDHERREKGSLGCAGDGGHLEGR